MFGKHIAHSLQRRASSNEVVEDDAVRFFWEIVHCEHRPDTLLGIRSYLAFLGQRYERLGGGKKTDFIVDFMC